MGKLLYEDLTYQIRGAYYDIYNAHGHDYPEDFYERMMTMDMQAKGLVCDNQVEYPVLYEGVLVGKQILDAVANKLVILEYKVAPQILPIHRAQLISYMKVSGLQVGLLMNFGGPAPDIVRLLNTMKGWEVVRDLDEQSVRRDLLYPDLTLQIMRGLQAIYNVLGPGFVLRVYANACRVEFRKRELNLARKRRLDIQHRGQPIGQLAFQHFIVDEKVVVAPVCLGEISDSEKNKVRTIMRRHGLKLGLIANFQDTSLRWKYERM